MLSNTEWDVAVTNRRHDSRSSLTHRVNLMSQCTSFQTPTPHSHKTHLTIFNCGFTIYNRGSYATRISPQKNPPSHDTGRVLENGNEAQEARGNYALSLGLPARRTVPKRFSNLSIRPAVSTKDFWPVKNG